MKTYKLTRPFDDGTVVHPRGAIVSLEQAPKSAKEISAEEIAAEKAALSDAEDAVKKAERAALKAEILTELAAAGGDPSEAAAKLLEQNELLKEALARATNKAEEAAAEVEAANKAAAAAATGGVDNDGEPLETQTTGKKTPVQKVQGAK